VQGLPSGQLANAVTRADVIAATEANRAFNIAAVDAYQAGGATGWNWETEPDACEECLAQEDQNPHSFDESADLPAHPNCMCYSTRED